MAFIRPTRTQPIPGQKRQCPVAGLKKSQNPLHLGSLELRPTGFSIGLCRRSALARLVRVAFFASRRTRRALVDPGRAIAAPKTPRRLSCPCARGCAFGRCPGRPAQPQHHRNWRIGRGRTGGFWARGCSATPAHSARIGHWQNQGKCTGPGEWYSLTRRF